MPDIRPASPEDAMELAGIRAEAMRPSLEAHGRFDADRARRRLLDGYSSADTRLIMAGGRIAGFYVLRLRSDHLYLDHLCLRPEEQGKGTGGQIIAALKDEARRLSLPLRLMALKGSPANAFYEKAGFRRVAETEFDNHCEWRPDGV